MGEIRITGHANQICGLSSRADVCRPTEQGELIEEIVFKPNSAPLFLHVGERPVTEGGQAAVDRAQDKSCVYELRQREATQIVGQAVRRACRAFDQSSVPFVQSLGDDLRFLPCTNPHLSLLDSRTRKRHLRSASAPSFQRVDGIKPSDCTVADTSTGIPMVHGDCSSDSPRFPIKQQFNLDMSHPGLHKRPENSAQWLEVHALGANDHGNDLVVSSGALPVVADEGGHVSGKCEFEEFPSSLHTKLGAVDAGDGNNSPVGSTHSSLLTGMDKDECGEVSLPANGADEPTGENGAVGRWQSNGPTGISSVGIRVFL